MMTDLRTFDQIGPNDVDTVGGKGLSLGLMAGAGLPVPPGFCITTAAFRRTRGRPLAEHADLVGPLFDAYRCLGGRLRPGHARPLSPRSRHRRRPRPAHFNQGGDGDWTRGAARPSREADHSLPE